MDSTLHTIVAAQYAQDRIARATAVRQAGDVRRSKPRERARLQAPRWFRRGVPADVLRAPALAPLEPR